MAERDIAAVLVRMPADVLARIDAYREQERQQRGGDTTRTSLIVHAITRWLASLEQERQPEGHERAGPVLLPREKLAGDDMSVPGYGFPEDEDESTQPADVPQLAAISQDPQPAPSRPSAAAQTASAATGRRGTPNLEAIAEAAAKYSRFPPSALAEQLFDLGIYRAKDRRTGAEKPVDLSTLRRLLDRAREAGLL